MSSIELENKSIESSRATKETYEIEARWCGDDLCNCYHIDIFCFDNETNVNKHVWESSWTAEYWGGSGGQTHVEDLREELQRKLTEYNLSADLSSDCIFDWGITNGSN